MGFAAEHAYVIPLLPLAGFLWILVSGILRKWIKGDIRIGDNWASGPSILLVCVAWLWSILLLIEILQRGPGTAYHFSYTWIDAGILKLNFGWLIDSMTAIMLIVVTTVAAMVQIYSRGYMAGDARFPRFYAYLSLFTMAMLILVLANNLVQLFMAWELMGLASYLLIGFWFEKPSAMRAAKKAFMVTRMGDVGLFFGIALLIGLTGTTNFMGLVVATAAPPAAHGAGGEHGAAPSSIEPSRGHLVLAGGAATQGSALLAQATPGVQPHTAEPVAPHGAPPTAGSGGTASDTPHASPAQPTPGAPTDHAGAAGAANDGAGVAATGEAPHTTVETLPGYLGSTPPHGAAPTPVHPGEPGADAHAPGEAAAAPATVESPPVTHNGWIPNLAVSAGPELLNKTSPLFGIAVAGSTLLGICALLIFCGSIGKSAQFPLHVWLPDAMEGPTPVSALIHAATMVAAGVYLVARMYPVFDYGGALTLFGTAVRPLTFVAIIGTITALMAAIIALTQPDIKRILAYSTISQLGFMMAGLGCGGVVVATAGEHAGHPELLKLGFTAGMFHLMTHAFFKGLLFLGSGSVIHGTGTQDIWEMGGLKRFMPKTFWTYFIGYIALAGVPGTAGFFSKDLILDAAWEFNRPIFGVLVFSAFLTAFYMTRQMMVVFSGQWSGGPAVVHHGHTSPTSDPHGSLHAEDATGVGHEQEEKPTPQADHDHGAHAAQAVHAPAHADDKTAHSSHDAHGAHGHHGEPHESPAVMWIPLAFLAALALLSGWVGIPGQVQIYQYLHYTRPDFAEPFHAHVNPVVIGSGTAAGFLGIFLGILAYRGRQFAPFRGRAVSPMAQRIYGLSYNKMYFDELYWNVLIVPMFIVTRALRLIDIWLVDGLVKGVGWLGLGLAVLWGLVDRHLVDGLVNGVGRGARLGGNGLRYLQSGQIQNYVLVVFAGIIILTWALVQSYLFR